MDYRKIYIKLIRKSQTRTLSSYYEKHHIFPVSIFGENKYIVNLTAREHYIAHLLLWKYYKKRSGDRNKKTTSMALAVHGMLNRYIGDRKISSRLFEILRQKAAEAISLKMTRCS